MIVKRYILFLAVIRGPYIFIINSISLQNVANSACTDSTKMWLSCQMHETLQSQPFFLCTKAMNMAQHSLNKTEKMWLPKHLNRLRPFNTVPQSADMPQNFRIPQQYRSNVVWKVSTIPCVQFQGCSCADLRRAWYWTSGLSL